MKALFFYLFGIISALYAFVILFNLYGPEFIDDYWLDYLVINYPNLWYYSSFTISCILILFIIVFVYNLGKGTNYERKEKLLIDENNQYE